MTAAVYLASPVKRARRTNDELAALDQQILDALRTCWPQSVRHVYYLMTNPRLPCPVPKTDKGYGVVVRRCIEMRRDGRMPYKWIRDSTRNGIYTNTFSGQSDFVERLAWQYRSDLWAGAARTCEVWCESKSVGGVLESVCDELAVTLYPSGGFSSLTFPYEAAQHLLRRKHNKPVTAFYIGDYDPAGVLIDPAIERELRLHLGDVVELDFVRLGVNAEHVEQYNLPTKPRKAGDKRSAEVEHTVEAEALPVPIMRELVRSNVLSWLPEGALEHAQQEDEKQQAALHKLARTLRKKEGRK